MAQMPNLRQDFWYKSVMMRWKEGQPLQPKAAAVSSGDAKVVAMLSHHCSHQQHVSFCLRRSQLLMAVLASRRAKSEAQLGGSECRVEVEGRPAIATHSCCSLPKQCQGCGNALTSQFLPATHVILHQEVPAVDGRSGLKPNLRPNLEDLNAVLRWKEGQSLQPTAVAASSSNARDVVMLSHHRSRQQHMYFCLRRSQLLMAVLASSQI